MNASTIVSSFCIYKGSQKRISISCNRYYACRTLSEEMAQRSSLETVCCMPVQAEVMLAPVDFLSADLQEAIETASAPALRWWLA